MRWDKLLWTLKITRVEAKETERERKRKKNTELYNRSSRCVVQFRGSFVFHFMLSLNVLGVFPAPEAFSMETVNVHRKNRCPLSLSLDGYVACVFGICFSIVSSVCARLCACLCKPAWVFVCQPTNERYVFGMCMYVCMCMSGCTSEYTHFEKSITVGFV